MIKKCSVLGKIIHSIDLKTFALLSWAILASLVAFTNFLGCAREKKEEIEPQRTTITTVKDEKIEQNAAQKAEKTKTIIVYRYIERQPQNEPQNDQRIPIGPQAQRPNGTNVNQQPQNDSPLDGGTVYQLTQQIVSQYVENPFHIEWLQHEGQNPTVQNGIHSYYVRGFCSSPNNAGGITTYHYFGYICAQKYFLGDGTYRLNLWHYIKVMPLKN